jgi:hypothetical protein
MGKELNDLKTCLMEVYDLKHIGACRAAQVFPQDVYHPMVISRGELPPDTVVDVEKVQSSPDPSPISPTEPPEPVEPPNERLRWWNTPYIPPFEEAHAGLRLAQLITFTFSLFALIMVLEHPKDYFQHGIWPLIYLITVPIFIGVQIYTIYKYGFRKSFSFLKDFFKSIVNSRSR